MECVKQSFDVYLKGIKMTGNDRTCFPWILAGENDQSSNRHQVLRRDYSF